MSQHQQPPTPSSSPPTFDVSAVGFLVLDTLCCPAEAMPPAGGAIFVDQMRMTPAGTAGGTAMVCGLLLHNDNDNSPRRRVRLASQVGQDEAGDWLIQTLGTKYHVDTSCIFRHNNDNPNKKIQTACSMLPIGHNAQRAAFFCPGTAATFTLSEPEQWQQALDARIVHLGGTGLLTAFDGAPSLQLVQQAKALGRSTVLDLILADDTRTAALVEPLLPYIDYFVPSIEEAAALAGCPGSRDAAQLAQHFLRKGVQKAVILTLDDEGVYACPSSQDEDDKPLYIPAHDVPVVDSTGCGDSFTAGVIVGLLQQDSWTLKQTVRFANAVAAQVAMGLGSDGDHVFLSQQSSNNSSCMEKTLEFMEQTPYRTSSSLFEGIGDDKFDQKPDSLKGPR